MDNSPKNPAPLENPLIFPAGFYWGAATSAHQVEGGNNNDWAEYEAKSAKRKAQNASKKLWPDYVLKNYPNPLQEENYVSGKACDHYNRFLGDFDIAKSLGHNAHRFSIEWSRIEPEEGKFDEKEIEHYREVIRALRERGMEPFVTLWHFTQPLWFVEKGGWERKENIFYFLRYGEYIASRFKNEMRFFITMSEPSMWAGQAYLTGIWPPQKKNIVSTAKVFFNLVRAHRGAYDKIKSVYPEAVVGLSENLEWPEPGFIRPFVRYFRNLFFLNRVARHLDFIGMNYYKRVTLLGKHNGDVSDLGWEIYPRGIYDSLLNLNRYGKPIFITENGVADARDALHGKFIKDHLQWVAEAIKAGVDVKGYFHWSLLDNFEWDSGFWPRLGLVEVDYKTLERKIRESAKVYADIIKPLNPRG